MTWKKKRPEAVPVSMASVRLLKLHTLLVKFTDQVDEVLDAAAQPIQFADDQRVAFAQGSLRFGQAGALGPAAADLVVKDLQS